MRVLLPLLRRDRDLPVVPLHLPSAGIADREHQRVARLEGMRGTIRLGENELAADYVDELIGVVRPCAVIRLGRRRFENRRAQFIAMATTFLCVVAAGMAT